MPAATAQGAGILPRGLLWSRIAPYSYLTFPRVPPMPYMHNQSPQSLRVFLCY